MKVVVSLIWALSFSMFISVQGTAQNTPNDLLLTAYEDPNLAAYENQLNFLKRKNFQLPIADEIELRYSNDERTLDDSRYQFRFRPGNPWKIRRNNALFNARRAEISQRQLLKFNENLYDRYRLIVDYLFGIQKAEISRKQFELSQRIIQSYERTVQTEIFDARDYVDEKLELIEFLEDYDERTIDVNRFKKQIQLILQTDAIDWSNFELVTALQIEETLNEVVASTFNSSELTYLKNQVEVARLETSVERSDFDLGFIQAEYAPYKNNGDNELGFSFGITIPIFKNNKDQLAERLLDEIELENEFESERYQDSLNKVLETEFLTDYLNHHSQLINEIEKLDLDKLSVNLAQAEDFDPIVLLELEEGKLKLEELVVRSNQRLMEHYLDFLFAFDALHQQPLRNYLAKDLSYLE